MKRLVLVVLLITLLAMPVFADWAVADLSPQGATSSHAFGIGNGKQVGNVRFSNGPMRAAMWNGTAESWVNLAPIGSTSSSALDIEEDVQVGYATIDGYNHASMWRGTASSWTDLHPEVATESGILSISGDKAVGYARIDGIRHPIIWDILTGQWTDLSSMLPYSADLEDINDNGDIAGSSSVNGMSHAGFMDASTDSWIDLNPVGAVNSWVASMSGDYQAGAAFIGQVYRAIIWYGSANSWIDLSPEESDYTYISGSFGNVQVGGTAIERSHAAMWSGSKDSLIDLHNLLPSKYTTSDAWAVKIYNGVTYIVGSAEATDFHTSAIIWRSQPIPEPSSILAICGGAAGLFAFRRRR